MNNGIDKVHKQLYIANITEGRTSPMDKYDVVITVCQDNIEDHIPSDVKYEFFNMADGKYTSDSDNGRFDYELFEEAAQTLLDHLKDNKTVMIHCHAGQSRSASTAIAALGVYTGSSYYDTYNNVKSHRPQINIDELLRKHSIKFIEDQLDINHEPFQS